MKGMDIYKSLGHISEEMIQEAEETTGKLSPHKWNWNYVSAMASSLALIFGLSLFFFQNGGSDGGMTGGAGGGMSGSSGSDGGMSGSSGSGTGEIGTSDTTAQVFTANQLEKVTVQLTEFQKDGFRCIVTETSNGELFPIDAKLTVSLEVNTTFTTENGEKILFHPDKPDILEFGVEIGSLIEVDYLYYYEYQEGNSLYNRVIAENVEIPN